MKKARQFDTKIVVASLCVAAAGWVAAQAQDAPMMPPSQSQTQERSTTSTNPDQPMKINKCSRLIGTRVENPQGDKLGRIDDVVVDFDTGRVSYCVLSVEKGIWTTPKYLAVPLAAFKPGADGSTLILNADKDKVAQAKGFDRESWPSVTNPAWGSEPFWQATPNATISAPTGQNKDMPAQHNNKDKSASTPMDQRDSE